MELARGSEQTYLPRVLAEEDELALRVRGLFVALIGGFVHGLGIAEAVHEEDYIRLFYLLFLKDGLLHIVDDCPSLTAVGLLEAVQLVDDDLGHGIPAVQDILIAIDVRHGILMLLDQGLYLQADQLVQAHLQDGVGLALRKGQLLRHDLGLFGLELDAGGLALHKAGLSHIPVLGAPENLNDQVYDIAGLDETLLYLLALHLLSQKIGVLSGGDLKLEVHVCLQHRLQPHGLRPAAADCQHVHTEGILQSGLLVQKVHEIFRIRILAKLYDDTDPFLGGLIGNIHNILGLLCFSQPGHIGKEFPDIGANHRIRDFGNDKVGLSAFGLFYFHLTPDFYFTHSGFIYGKKIIFINHNSPGREIGAFHILHKFFCRNFRVFHISFGRINNLCQIMGRNAAIPTAMPSEPFTRRLGTFTGSTAGSFSVSSKLGIKSTTSLSKSERKASWVTFSSLASV